MKKRKKQEALKEKTHSKNAKIMIISKGRTLSAWIEGAERILLCLSGSVRILLSGEVLSLCGKGLVCTTYAAGAIEVNGIIEEIRFEPSPSSVEKER